MPGHDRLSRIRPTINWMLTQALTDFVLKALVAETAKRLVAAGYPLYRLHVSTQTLHPLYAGTEFTWVRGEGWKLDPYGHTGTVSDAWLQSPLCHMIENGLGEYRLRIHRGEGGDYPVIREMQAKGATDYLALLTPFGDPQTAIQRKDGVLMSWSADAPAGWSERDVADLRHLQSRLAVVLRLAMRQRLAENVVSAYLGADAGKRILAGQIQRGDGEDIEAIIWFSDLRSSTRLAESLGKEVFLELLNCFFECTGNAVQAVNGEILDYIGDSILAIFPFAKLGGAEQAGRLALQAAMQASTDLAEVNRARQARGEEPLGFGIGLHSGTVMFGNIGIPDRLNFSVVGSATNEAARVAEQCRDLNEEIIVSEKFRNLTNTQWRALGTFKLRNVSKPMPLFAPL